MASPYHAGELAAQARAGVQVEAERINKSIRATLPEIAQVFLQSQRMVVVSSIDTTSRAWASLLTGESGFIEILDEQTIEIHAVPHAGDPLAASVLRGGDVGLLAIDFEARRRMRLNGWMEQGQKSLVVHTNQVYANCPKYIQMRSFTYEESGNQSPCILQTEQLTDRQQEWIKQADTFFIATYYPDYGADASHRGGLPGFVHIDGAGRLLFPDYPGNRMFQTLGNISVNPYAGLLFLDFMQGDTLQLTGKAQVIWDKEQAIAFTGSERAVEFVIDEVIEVREASPLRGQLIEYSPWNPQ
jgi:predicted pyridoxine 5'-phosphate oxidase superfamily flavin-nucleotide-binding protein